MSVRKIAAGDLIQRPSVLNRPLEDVLTGSGYLVDGSDFAGFAPVAAAGTATFGASSITEVRAGGLTVTTAFNADGSITTVYGAPVSKTVTTTFTASGVTDTVV